MGHERVHFRSALLGAVIGALIIGVLTPVGAAVGDYVRVGKLNQGKATTTFANPTGPAVKLAGDKSGPSFKVNSRRRINRLNADRVDGRHADQIIRMVDNTTHDAADTNGNILSATIQVPKAGFLLTYGSVDGFGNAWDYYTCRIKVDAKVVTNSQRDATVHYQGVYHTDNREEDCAATGAIQVGPGSHTVHLNMGDVQTVSLGAASVWALYVPFDFSGSAP
jgi:hypothetical protein